MNSPWLEDQQCFVILTVENNESLLFLLQHDHRKSAHAPMKASIARFSFCSHDISQRP
jgi:hypothetical protein